MSRSSTTELNRAAIKAFGLEGKMVHDITIHFHPDGIKAVVTISISNELAAGLGAGLQRVAEEEKS